MYPILSWKKSLQAVSYPILGYPAYPGISWNCMVFKNFACGAPNSTWFQTKSPAARLAEPNFRKFRQILYPRIIPGYPRNSRIYPRISQKIPGYREFSQDISYPILEKISPGGILSYPILGVSWDILRILGYILRILRILFPG